MSSRVRWPSTIRRGAAALALLAVIAGCGSSSKHPATSTENPSEQQTAALPASCTAIVIKTLGRVVERIYHEGVRSQRTASAMHIVSGSPALKAALEAGDATAARAAARKLLATGHITDLRVIAGGRTLVSLGKPAITPLRGTLTNARGEAIATYLTSVWSDEGFMAEVGGAIEGFSALRQGAHSTPGSFPLPAGALARSGTLKRAGITYDYTSFTGEAFPAGSLRIYLLRAASTSAELCRHNGELTILAVLHHVANLIYDEERGPPARRQVARVEHNAALLAAVAQRQPAATEAAIKALLNEHIVRLRVYGRSGEQLGDVGGPYVLAPVHGTLRSGGRTIGTFVLSVQDDEGYEKLAKRLEGLDVLVYMNGQIVKNSLGPVSWGEVPANGSYAYRGRRYRVFTVHAQAFPSGALSIRVLVPEPYLAQRAR